MQNDFQQSSRPSSPPALIIGLGLCMLVSAWDVMPSAKLASFWTSVGLFAIAAGVGLGVLEKARMLSEEASTLMQTQLKNVSSLIKFTAFSPSDTDFPASCRSTSFPPDGG